MVTQAAMASETPDPPATTFSAAGTAGGKGAALAAKLGTARSAGNWVDAQGRPVVAVTDERAAAEVRGAGAEAKVVGHSMNELKSATTALRSAPRVTGTAWAVDYRTNRIVVSGDRTVSSGDWTKMTQVASRIGDFVTMQRTQGTFTTRLNGAQPILSTGGRCSAGFNVTNGQRDFILTAGHCGPTGSIWFADGQGTRQLGATVNSSFPGGDFSLVQYDTGKAGQGADVVAVGGGKGCGSPARPTPRWASGCSAAAAPAGCATAR